MTAGRRVVLLPAVIGPEAAWLIFRDMGEAIEAKGRRLSAYRETAGAGRQMLLAAGQLEESGRQWQAARGAGSGSGTSEPRESVGGGSSELLPSSRWWTAAQVAEEAGCSDSWVRRQCRTKRLPATFVGGAYHVDEDVAKQWIRNRSRDE